MAKTVGLITSPQDSLGWKRWYSEEKAENADLPRSARDLNQFQRLFLLRVMRQDRAWDTKRPNGGELERMGSWWLVKSTRHHYKVVPPNVMFVAFKNPRNTIVISMINPS